MSRAIELRRHTDNEGDVLSAEGIEAAVEIGRGLAGNYRLAVSTGAQRATQTVACFLAGLGQRVPDGVVVEAALRSKHEDRWRELAGQADGGDLAAFREVDAAFVDAEAASLGASLRGLLERIADGGRILAVGHSPTNEAAVLGLTREVVQPMAKGAGVLVTEDGGTFTVESLD